MSDIKQELDKIRGRISEPSFLKNEGLSNEVGIHVFCYDPADELIVRDFVSRLKAESGMPYHIKECDLYEIFLRLLEDKRVLKSVDGLEEKRGKEYLLKQLQKIATPEALLEYMKYEPHEYGDVLFLTGVGKSSRLCALIKCWTVCSISLRISPSLCFIRDRSTDKTSDCLESFWTDTTTGHSTFCNWRKTL